MCSIVNAKRDALSNPVGYRVVHAEKLYSYMEKVFELLMYEFAFSVRIGMTKLLQN
jgi:hypothetical protein